MGTEDIIAIQLFATIRLSYQYRDITKIFFFEILPCINNDIDPVHMLWFYTLGLTITPSAIIRALKPVYKYS